MTTYTLSKTENRHKKFIGDKIMCMYHTSPDVWHGYTLWLYMHQAGHVYMPSTCVSMTNSADGMFLRAPVCMHTVAQIMPHLNLFENHMYHRIPQICPPLQHASIGQNRRGLISIDDQYQPANATWVHDFCTFIGWLMSKIQEKTQIRL